MRIPALLALFLVACTVPPTVLPPPFGEEQTPRLFFPTGMAVTGLLRLAALTGRDDLRQKAEATLTAYQGVMNDSPIAVGQMLIALDFLLGPVQEFAVVGDAADAETKQVLALIRKDFRPNKVLAFRDAKAGDDVALLKGKAALGAVTTYICQNLVCEAPLVGVVGPAVPRGPGEVQVLDEVHAADHGRPELAVRREDVVLRLERERAPHLGRLLPDERRVYVLDSSAVIAFLQREAGAEPADQPRDDDDARPADHVARRREG